MADEPPFICPRCCAVSHHPTDAAEGYCGACHDWTRLSGGVYDDGAGGLHIVAGELLEANGIADTLANRDAIWLAAQRTFARLIRPDDV